MDRLRTLHPLQTLHQGDGSAATVVQPSSKRGEALAANHDNHFMEEIEVDHDMSQTHTLTSISNEFTDRSSTLLQSSASSLSRATLRSPDADCLCQHLETLDSDVLEESKQEQQQGDPDEDDEREPPNGGLRAWSVVFASFFIQTFTFASEFIFGVFEHNYLAIYPEAGPSRIALIGTIGSSTTYLSGFISGYLSDRFGYRLTASIGTFIMTISLILASFSTQLWHLYLTQGILLGFGASLLYYAAVGAPAHWFTTRRGLAMGISSGGSGVGGFYLAPLTQLLVDKTGLPWTLRVLALYCLCTCGIASLLLIEFKQTPRPKKEKPQVSISRQDAVIESPLITRLLPVIREPVFQVLVASQVFLALAYLTPVYYMEVYATQVVGLSEQLGASIIGWFNGATVISRIASGVMADRFSKSGVLIVYSWVTCIAVVAIWPLATSTGLFITYALIFGIAFGGMFTVTPVMMADYYGAHRVSTILGIVYGCCSMALISGVLISGHLLEATQPTVGFLPLIMFSGACFAMAAILSTLWAYLLRRKANRVMTAQACQEATTTTESAL